MASVQQRYNNDAIYTYIGDIVIAMNPYCDLPLYAEEKRQEYTDVRSKNDHPPHIYIISDRAYQNLKDTGCNQCCVVSGESGAGKTETTKLLVEHIAHLCKHDDSNLHEKIVAVNPLLEAFGNAQTVINNNSSRFGKFIELVFDHQGQIIGAKISEYLLEKSRLVKHGVGEKNFHIFYYLFAGLEQAKLKANLLMTPEKHRIMEESDNERVYKDGERVEECKHMWNVLQSLMSRVGFKKEDIEGIEAILTAILHLSDIRFVPHHNTEGVSIQNDDTMILTSQLLAVDAEKLVDALILTTSTVNNETITSLKTQEQAADCRDAVSKALYGRMFSWIVLQINKLLAPNLSRRKPEEVDWIGILDIYGFENFKVNSFEQLCINIANEQLQLFFNQHIFKLELKEYETEGISGGDVVFVDNQPLLDLFLELKNPPGIFAILDEESKFPKGTDQSLVNKLNNNFQSHNNFQATKAQTLNFTILHFAGPVTYNVHGFLAKNRDTLSANLVDCLKDSESILVNDLFSPLTEIGGTLYKSSQAKKRKDLRMSRMVVAGATIRKKKPLSSEDLMKRASRLIMKQSGVIQVKDTVARDSSLRSAKTLASSFSNSLCGLIVKMMEAQPHFIRCIKPNGSKKAGMFEEKMVLEQLNYSGVLETIRIRKQGFSSRLYFEDFVNRYGLIGGVLSVGEGCDCRGVCATVMKTSQLEDWRLGKTKLFLRHYHVERLDALYREASHQIAVCQTLWRGALARKKLQQLREAARQYQLQAEQLSTSLLLNQQQFSTQLEQIVMQDVSKNKTTAIQQPNDQVKKGSKLAAATAAALDAAALKGVVIRQKPTRNTMTPSQNIEVLNTLTRLEAIDENSPLSPSAGPSYLPPIYKDIKATSLDPVYVFLQESLSKINTLPTDIWGKLYFMEKNAIIGKLYVKDNDILIDDSRQNYTGCNIGINAPAFEHLSNDDVRRTVNNIGRGISIQRDEYLNIYARRHTDINVYIHGSQDPDRHCFPDSVNKKNSKVSTGPTKIFDIEVFKTKLSKELKKSNPNIGKILAYTCFSFSFEKQSTKEVELPVWVCIINISALDLLGKPQVLAQLVAKGLLNADSNTSKLWSQLDFKRSLENFSP